jgi:hypothetical protein
MDENCVSIYDPLTEKFINLASMGCLDGLIPQSYFEPDFVLVRFLEKSPIVVDFETLDKL